MDEGMYAVYKPVGKSSFAVVAGMRMLTGIRKVGHGGTLDPLAHGVLVIGCGRQYTKQLSTVIAGGKVYEAEVTLGTVSKTYDAEGPLTAVPHPLIPQLSDIEAAVDTFVGSIQQAPPNYSAVHYKGKRAYQHARDGASFTLPDRTVEIHEIRILSYAWPTLVLWVRCGSGVYIRSLAHDLGEVLGCGGYLSALCRTCVGDYSLEDCIYLPWLFET